MKTLIVLESGTKIKYFEKYLDKDKYIISACFGHIRDLESKKMSIDIDNKFNPTYKMISSKKTIISNLKTQMKKCDHILLACDNDREGESISWHISEILKINKKNRKRLIFNEITKSSILKCIENPKDLNMDLVYAQQARRLLDRLIGFSLSPLLWKHIQNSYKKEKTLSAGRVQSVVLKLIIERETEIKKFESKNSYKVNSIFLKGSNEINCVLNKEIPDIKETKVFLETCHNSIFKVDKINKNNLVSKPSNPFITSTLQQEANNKFKMSPKITMLNAQKLYEKGYITYHRTDSIILSQEAKDSIKEYISEHFGIDYFNDKVLKNNKQNCQEAHEAIRPSNISLDSITNEDMNDSEKKLYKMIWNRTIASLMSECKKEIVSFLIKSKKIKDNYFIYKTEKIIFDGFQKIYSNEHTKKVYYTLDQDEILEYKNIKGTEKYSTPSKLRFTEASLIKRLEDLGIGRPSTYANMVEIVQNRNYIEKKDIEGKETDLNIFEIKKDDSKIYETKCKTNVGSEKQKLVSTNIGNIVNTFMTNNFDNIINYKYTSILEDNLDLISQGKLIWYDFLKNIYSDLIGNKLFRDNYSLEKDKYKKILGKYPGTKSDICCYIGQYGPVVKYVKDKKTIYASLGDIKIEDITIEDAINLLQYPKVIGNYKNLPVTIKMGSNGVYLNYNKKNYSIEKEIDINEAKKVIGSNNNSVIKTFNKDIIIKNGKYGPYIHYKNKYFINIKTDPKKITETQCDELIKQKFNH